MAVMAGHRPSKTDVNALVSRPSRFLRFSWNEAARASGKKIGPAIQAGPEGNQGIEPYAELKLARPAEPRGAGGLRNPGPIPDRAFEATVAISIPRVSSD